jgi:subtilisin family serine protease
MEDWGSMPRYFLTHHVRPLLLRKRGAARICLLASGVLIALGTTGDGAPAFRRFAAPAAPRPAVTARPAAPSFGRNTAPARTGAEPGQPAASGGAPPLVRGPGGAMPERTGQPEHAGQLPERGPQGPERGPAERSAAERNSAERSPQEHATAGRPNETGRPNEAGRPNDAGQHRESSLGRPELGRGAAPVNAFRNGGFPSGMPRNGLPRRPFPGEAGFTGVPPRGETRFISNEMVFHVAPNVAPATVDAAAHRLGLVTVASHNLSLSGGTLMHFRIDNGRPVSDVVRDLEGQNIGVAQPNYVYRLQQDGRTPAPLQLPALPPLPRGDPAQYAVAKLHLTEAHKIATGAGVLVAVIDSQIDTGHPDLGGTIAGSFDAVGNREKPDEHGTEMTGAIVAHRKLLGVAPRARILAIHAFSPDAQSSAQTTTAHILAGIDWAIAKGARVINMSFAGPYDPLLSHALKKAHDKGIVLIAAAGNAGPKSPPLYPAADENVIAVTAVDENDKLLPQANQGAHIALAAPGVNVLEPAPGGTYGYTTGTSVASAHVSGVAALIIERDPGIDVATLEEVLYSSARDLGPKGRDSQFGYGLVDPLHALDALEAKVAMTKPTAPVAATPLPKPLHVSAATDTTAEKMTVSQLPPNQAEPAPASPTGQPAVQAPTPPPMSAQAPAQAPTSAQAPAQAPAQFPANAAAALTPGTPVNRVPRAPATLAPGPGAIAPAATRSSAIDPSTDFVPAAEKRRLDGCLQDGATKGHRGADLRDYATVCLAEARLTCLKQAVAQKVRGTDRRDFMGRCLGS